MLNRLGDLAYEQGDTVAAHTWWSEGLRLAQHSGGGTAFWYATQVYQRKKEGWRVIHTHWSSAKGERP